MDIELDVDPALVAFNSLNEEEAYPIKFIFKGTSFEMENIDPVHVELYVTHLLTELLGPTDYSEYGRGFYWGAKWSVVDNDGISVGISGDGLEPNQWDDYMQRRIKE